MFLIRPLTQLALWITLLLAPVFAEADTAVVDNRANVFASNDTLDAPGLGTAQAFATGPDEVVLSSVVVSLDVTSDSTFRVKVWSGS